MQIATWYHFQLFLGGVLGLPSFLPQALCVSPPPLLHLIDARGTQDLADSGSLNSQGQGVISRWVQEWNRMELVSQDT